MKVINLDPRLPLNDQRSLQSRRVNASGIPFSKVVSDSSNHELLAERFWYCWRCRRNEETCAASHLRAASGVEAFCPRIRFAQVNRKKRIWVNEPLFPGYFFAKLDHRMLAQTSGIYDLVKLGDRYAVASDELIEKLKEQARATELGDSRSALVAGEPWRGLDDMVSAPEITILQILAGRERIKQLLNFFQQPADAQLSDDSLSSSIVSGSELLRFCARVRVRPARYRAGRGPECDMEAGNRLLSHLQLMPDKVVRAISSVSIRENLS
jgi:transcriptional antiterminator RfaH